MDYGLADVEDLGTEARQHACQLGSKAGPVLAGHVDEKDFAHGNLEPDGSVTILRRG